MPGPLNPSTLPDPELAHVGLQTVRAIVNPVWSAPLAALSFLLILTNLSNSLFGNVLGALQALASTVGCLALPMPREMFCGGSSSQIWWAYRRQEGTRPRGSDRPQWGADTGC